MPTTATSLASMTVSHPAARMRSPPRPKNSGWRIPREAARRRRASINPAPYISPEASPAEMRMRMDGGRIAEKLVVASSQLPVAGWLSSLRSLYFVRHPTHDLQHSPRRRGTDSQLGTVNCLIVPDHRSRLYCRFGRENGDFLVLVLELVELVVDAALGEQLLVRAHFSNLALVHDDDLVGALHGREAVRD